MHQDLRQSRHTREESKHLRIQVLVHCRFPLQASASFWPRSVTLRGHNHRGNYHGATPKVKYDLSDHSRGMYELAHYVYYLL